MQKTRYCSYRQNNLAEGCKLCVQGKKLVLFVTGICPRHCFYCPISETKYQHDVTYANEWPTNKIKDIITEAKLCSAEGAGITGGDPLARLERTCQYIRQLKKTFGKKFHIHLYTSFDLANEKTLKKLSDAGLDEIRFHAEIDSNKIWKKIGLVKKFPWKTGIEIPVIPGKESKTKKLIDYFADKIDFLNLNELEYSDTNACHLKEMDFHTKDSLSYGIKGSETLALRLLGYIKKNHPKLNAHYCTAKLKDRVQLAKRIKLRAKNVKKPYDQVTSEGLLIRGAIYLPELSPNTFGYRRKLAKSRGLIKKLVKIKSSLDKKYGKRFDLDIKKLRILTDINTLKKIKEPLVKAIVKEYPTWDQLEVEINQKI